ncbi:unnamed protein product [Hermetia illucens]|uniref:PRA1 family protein n=1 Tax=Hermetia illucens TaxID=343691 RepID=A0A7R8V8M3_HERIL|nr:prenylated Rab acceptor protein 1 [Hermetia illucens]CAD7094163.1 unnamed protein product [Hermetia illucens]
MDDVSVDISGNMNVPGPTVKDAIGSATEPNSKISFSNITTKLPTSIGQILKQVRKDLRPVSEFFNVNNFKKPTSIQRLMNRLTRNLSYFQSNYICVFLILMAYCLITSPLILFVLAGVLFACYQVRLANTQFTIFGKTLNTSQQCLIINCMAAPILYLVGAGAALFWTLGASLFLIMLHASSYNIDAIVTEDMEGFLTEVV